MKLLGPRPFLPAFSSPCHTLSKHCPRGPGTHTQTSAPKDPWIDRTDRQTHAHYSKGTPMDKVMLTFLIYPS